MKVRTITFGVSLEPDNFKDGSLSEIIKRAAVFLSGAKQRFECEGYVVQTVRISLNTFEHWLLPLLTSTGATIKSTIQQLITCLEMHDISFCTIGSCSSAAGIELVPSILALSDRLSASVTFPRIVTRNGSVDASNRPENDANNSTVNVQIAPDYELCKLAARASLQLASECGDLGNFRFGTSFNCAAGTPFFPAAYHTTAGQPTVSIGLECGDLLFMAFHAADTANEGRDNLVQVLRQALLPVQRCIQEYCSVSGNEVSYGGIDASINPGLELPASVGAGLEDLLHGRDDKRTNSSSESDSGYFGCMGTIATVSAVTSAIKALRTSGASTGTGAITGAGDKHDCHDVIKLTGYSGLMLPVMEDLVLAQRAKEGRFGLRDLLAFSAVCGVGLDTVPIPGDTTVEQLAGVYTAVGALAFRLDKPLSCRLLPQLGKVLGDETDVNSPFLCNTTVFAIP